MATDIYFHITETTPYESSGSGEDPAVRDALRLASSQTAASVLMDATAGGLEPRAYVLGGINPPVAWYSERIAAQVTISGPITVTTYAKESVDTVNARLRMKLWKRSAGGSEIDTLIGQGDGTAELTTIQAAHTLTITPTVPITLSLNERLIFRVYAIPASGQTMGAGTVTMYYRGTVANTGETKVSFTETITFLDNETKLFFRRESTIGIGVFKDLLTTQGSVARTDAVVAVNGAETQWTLNPGVAVAKDQLAGPIADTSNVTSYTNGFTFTPIAGTLYLLAVVHADAAPETTIPTISTTTGLVFVQIATVPFDTIASNVHRLTLFRAMKLSGLVNGTITVDLADAATGCCAHLSEVKGLLTTGIDGADAVRNIVTGSANAGANPSITLAAFADAANGVYACFGSDIATVPTPGAGFTMLLHNTIATPTTGLFTEWRQTNDTSVDCTLAASDWGGVALELVAAPTGAVMEWITKRFRDGFTLRPVTGSWLTVLAAYQSDALANTTPRLKFSRWRNGVETEFLNAKHPTQELTQSPGSGITFGSTSTQLTQIDFLPDDRLVVRLYVTNAASLTLGTGYAATFQYDETTGAGYYVKLLQTATFKEETDPANDPANVPGGLMMSGMGL